MFQQIILAKLKKKKEDKFPVLNSQPIKLKTEPKFGRNLNISRPSLSLPKILYCGFFLSSIFFKLFEGKP